MQQEAKNYKYVHYAQQFMDYETDLVFDKISKLKNDKLP